MTNTPGPGITLFQIVTIAVLAVLVAYSLRAWLVLGRRRMALACLLFLIAGIAIAFPRTTQFIANRLGIDRGADLVAYMTTFAAIGCYFLTLYSHRRLRIQITELTRQLALAQLPARESLPPEWRQTAAAAADESR